MDGKELLLAIGDIDSTLIAEAAQKKAFQHRAHSAKWIALAAGLTVVIAAAASLPALLRPPVEQEPESGIVPAAEGTSVSNESSVAESTEADLPAGAAPQDSGASAPVRISRTDLHLNSVSDFTACMLYYPPEKYDEIHWNSDDINHYFGRDLTPAYLPEGIGSPSGNGSATIYRQKSDGAIAYDTVREVYGQTGVEYTDSGEAILAEGLMITASRLGIMTDCIYVLPGEDGIRTSDIAGTAVTIGYREMTYGPYDPETHAPSGTYPLYVFRFTLDGVEYDITTHNLPLDEGVKITASFITGSAEIEIIE